MTQNIYVTGAEAKSGKSVIAPGACKVPTIEQALADGFAGLDKSSYSNIVGEMLS